jgi:hypothetical protein
MSVFESCRILYKELKQLHWNSDEKDCKRLQDRCVIFESLFEKTKDVEEETASELNYVELRILLRDIMSFIIQYTKRVDFSGMIMPAFRKRYLSSLASLHERMEQLYQKFNLTVNITKEERRKQDIEVFLFFVFDPCFESFLLFLAFFLFVRYFFCFSSFFFFCTVSRIVRTPSKVYSSMFVRLFYKQNKIKNLVKQYLKI